MEGEIRVVDDVPSAFAELVSARFSESAETRGTSPFRIAASGGNSGTACFSSLSTSSVDFSEVELFFVDERCVDPSDPESNQYAIAAALARQMGRLVGFHPMSCTEGPAAYEEELREVGRLDLVQLGLGPDGHTASLFPASSALELDRSRLVARNADPSGTNGHDRLTLTYSGIALGALVVITVIGAARASVLREIVDGADFPASRVSASEVIWLVDTAAATLLEGDSP